MYSRQTVIPPRNTEPMQHIWVPSPLPDGQAPVIFTPAPPPRLGGTVRNVPFIASRLARSPIILRIPKVILLAVKWSEREGSYPFLSTKEFKNVRILNYIPYLRYHGEISRFLQLINFYNITRKKPTG